MYYKQYVYRSKQKVDFYIDKSKQSVYNWTCKRYVYTRKEVNMNQTLIANRLKAYRGSMTQKEVADAVGVTAMAISQYEKGERIPRDDVKVKIAKLFNKTVDEIFFAE